MFGSVCFLKDISHKCFSDFTGFIWIKKKIISLEKCLICVCKFFYKIVLYLFDIEENKIFFNKIVILLRKAMNSGK